MNRLSLPVRRMLAVTILVLMIFIPYQFLFSPVVSRYHELIQTERRERALLERFQLVGKKAEMLRGQLETLREAESASSGGYLTGDSETLVAADLQNLVRTTVERSGGRLESTQILPAEIDGDFRRVSLRVRMTADMSSLFRTMYDLESHSPYLFIDNIDIISRGSRRREDNDSGLAMSVAYDVFGYMRES